MIWFTWKLWRLAWARESDYEAISDPDGVWTRLVGRLFVRNGSRLRVSIVWMPSCCWVGLTHERGWECPEALREEAEAIFRRTGDAARAGLTRRRDWLVCVVPCVGVHLTWRAKA